MTYERDLGFAVHQLHETLRLLALDARDQVAALPDYVAVPNELALNWDDCERSLDWLVEEGQISASEGSPAPRPRRIDRSFALASDAGDPAIGGVVERCYL